MKKNDYPCSLIITKKNRIKKYLQDDEYKKRVQLIEIKDKDLEELLITKLKEQENKNKIFFKQNKEYEFKCYCNDRQIFTEFHSCNYIFFLNPYDCKNIICVQNYYINKNLYINDNCKFIKDLGNLRHLETLNLKIKNKKYYNIHCLKNLKQIVIRRKSYHELLNLNNIYGSIKGQLKKLLKINNKLKIDFK